MGQKWRYWLSTAPAGTTGDSFKLSKKIYFIFYNCKIYYWLKSSILPSEAPPPPPPPTVSVSLHPLIRPTSAAEAMHWTNMARKSHPSPPASFPSRPSTPSPQPLFPAVMIGREQRILEQQKAREMKVGFNLTWIHFLCISSRLQCEEMEDRYSVGTASYWRPASPRSGNISW